MKRDMDLIRKLLMHFEEYDSFSMEEKTKIDGYDNRIIDYHLLLLAQADMIVCEASKSTTNPERYIKVYPFGLSWKGHEFLDAARDESLWNKAKAKVIEVTGGLSLYLIQSVLLYYAKQGLGIKE